MSEKIVSLVDRKLIPDPLVVSACRELLSAAESGRLRGLLYAAEDVELKIVTETVGSYSQFSSIGMLERLKFRVLRQMDNTSEAKETPDA